MKRIAIYSRKSKETEKGESVKNQIQMCKDYFSKKYDDCVFQVFQDEGFSGGNTNRPQFQRMMLLAKRREFDCIACYKIDRIARNIIDFMNTFDILKKNSVSLVSITEGFDPNTPTGMMMMTMIAGFAEMERMSIAQRIKDNMTELAKLGRWSGGTPPFGYKPVKIQNGNKIELYLELIPEYQEKIKSAFKCLAEGHTIRQSAKILNMPDKTVANLINNPTYCQSDDFSAKYLKTLGYEVFGEIDGHGYLAYNRRIKDKTGKKLFNAKGMFVSVSKHTPAVSSSLWIAANEQIRKRGEEARPRISQFSFLAHLVKCSCGSGMYLTPGNRKKDGSRVYYFGCSRKKYDKSACDNGWINAAYLEKDVLSSLNRCADDTEYFKKYISTKNDTNIDFEIKKLKKAITKNDVELDNLAENIGLLTGSAAKKTADRMNKLSKKNDFLSENLLKLERANLLDNFDSYSISTLQKNIKYLLDSWDSLNIERKQLLIKNIIKEVLWDGKKKFKIKFNL